MRMTSGISPFFKQAPFILLFSETQAVCFGSMVLSSAFAAGQVQAPSTDAYQVGGARYERTLQVAIT